jgi:hypothetical protein
LGAQGLSLGGTEKVVLAQKGAFFLAQFCFSRYFKTGFGVEVRSRVIMGPGEGFEKSKLGLFLENV